MTQFFTIKLSLQAINYARSKVYQNLVKQPCVFFHAPENSTGNLTALLSTDISVLSSMSIESYLQLLNGLIMYSMAIGTALYYHYKIGLLSLLWLIIILLLVYVQSREETRMAREKKDRLNTQRKNITDFVLNHTTVTSLANEDVLVENFTGIPRLGKY